MTPDLPEPWRSQMIASAHAEAEAAALRRLDRALWGALIAGAALASVLVWSVWP